MSNTLKIGSKYSLYTNYSTIVGKKVEVVGIITFNECEKYAYDIQALAINERVIALKDDNLEKEIGTDNIYLLRETVANTDGTYNEYLVWDSIINYNKTTVLNEEYTMQFKISIPDTKSYSIDQILSGIQNYIESTYSGVKTEFEILSTSSSSSSSKENNMTTTLTQEILSKAESIINSLNGFETRLIPAVERINNLDISGKMDDIANDLQNISSEISLVKRGL